MYTNKDGSLGLVSNPSETEIQGISAHENSTALVSNVRTLSWYERHVNKRHVGQINNGMLIDPRRRIAADLGKLTTFSYTTTTTFVQSMEFLLLFRPLCICARVSMTSRRSFYLSMTSRATSPTTTSMVGNILSPVRKV